MKFQRVDLPVNFQPAFWSFSPVVVSCFAVSNTPSQSKEETIQSMSQINRRLRLHDITEYFRMVVVSENGIIPDKTPLHRKRESTSLPLPSPTLLISVALQLQLPRESRSFSQGMNFSQNARLGMWWCIHQITCLFPFMQYPLQSIMLELRQVVTNKAMLICKIGSNIGRSILNPLTGIGQKALPRFGE